MKKIYLTEKNKKYYDSINSHKYFECKKCKTTYISEKLKEYEENVDIDTCHKCKHDSFCEFKYINM